MITGKQKIYITICLFAIYSTIYYLMGNKQHFNISDENKYQLTFLDSIYFNIITITSIGYGDISPKSQLMRGICISKIILFLFVLNINTLLL